MSWTIASFCSIDLTLAFMFIPRPFLSCFYRVSMYIPPRYPHCSCTDSIKINRPGYNIRMYWTHFWQPIIHIQQNIFENTLLEVCSSHLYASFGTFSVQIGQLLAPQWVFKHSEEFRNRRHFPSKTANCRFSNIL